MHFIYVCSYLLFCNDYGTFSFLPLSAIRNPWFQTREIYDVQYKHKKEGEVGSEEDISISLEIQIWKSVRNYGRQKKNVPPKIS